MGFKDIKSIFVGIRRILRGSMKDQENSLRRLKRSGEEDKNKKKEKEKKDKDKDKKQDKQKNKKNAQLCEIIKQ